jgi:hypothetical protein
MNLINRILGIFNLKLSSTTYADGITHDQMVERERELRRKLHNQTALTRYYRTKCERLSNQT